ncbi:MAG: sensor histidine kinase [Ilumatobacter sp.]|jgi:signal transduction histidine kinase|uniref:sensor histidine kinase n=1 Tax=Ilumatobacter sp. TaxID=1967498 RepID=UPI00391DDAB3
MSLADASFSGAPAAPAGMSHGDLSAIRHRAHGMNRLGRRFLGATLAVLGVAIMMIAIAAQTMFINSHDLRLLMWVLIPAVLGAAVVAVLLARPVARDAKRICDAAMRVADGDLTARTGVRRNDELGEAAEMFDVMVARLDAVEYERSLMLSSISHDLRTPLAALRAAVEAIRDGVAPDPDLYLSGMERQVRALTSLVDDLQLYTRLVSGTLHLNTTRLDLNELADEAMETLRPLAEPRSVRLLLDADSRVMADVDGSQLARVIRNLLDNAIRYAPDGSVVLVRIAERNGRATMQVIDEGPGFPTDFRAHAFEPFTRADEARDTRTGTAGLGLSIAKGIVAAHRGTVSLGEGPGGVVLVTLPVDVHGAASTLATAG